MVWDMFDGFYTSWSAGMKLDMDFYKLVLNETEADPLRRVFVDDNLGNVLVARSFGITNVFENTGSCARVLRNLFGNPLLREERFLVENARLESITEDGDMVRDNLSQSLILSVTRKRDLVAFKEHCGKDIWDYFAEDLKHGLKTFPDDMDTTSVALLTLNLELKTIESVMDKMLSNVNQNGIIKVYFNESTTVIDPVSCVNDIQLFFRHGRGDQAQKSMNWITDVLIHQAYVDGTKRYVHPDCFLYFLSCLCASKERDIQLNLQLREALEVCLRERIGLAGDSLDIAIRTLVC